VMTEKELKMDVLTSHASGMTSQPETPKTNLTAT
jgi:hypothetical protein